MRKSFLISMLFCVGIGQLFAQEATPAEVATPVLVEEAPTVLVTPAPVVEGFAAQAEAAANTALKAAQTLVAAAQAKLQAGLTEEANKLQAKATRLSQEAQVKAQEAADSSSQEATRLQAEVERFETKAKEVGDETSRKAADDADKLAKEAQKESERLAEFAKETAELATKQAEVKITVTPSAATPAPVVEGFAAQAEAAANTALKAAQTLVAAAQAKLQAGLTEEANKLQAKATRLSQEAQVKAQEAADSSSQEATRLQAEVERFETKAKEVGDETSRKAADDADKLAKEAQKESERLAVFAKETAELATKQAEVKITVTPTVEPGEVEEEAVDPLFNFNAELQTARGIGTKTAEKRQSTLTALNNLLPKITKDHSSSDRKGYVKAIRRLYFGSRAKAHTEIKDALKVLVQSVQANEAFTEFIGVRFGSSWPRKFNQFEADFAYWEFYNELQIARRIGVRTVARRKDTLTELKNLLPKIKKDLNSDYRKRYVKEVRKLYLKSKKTVHTEIKADLKSLVQSVQTNEALAEFMDIKLVLWGSLRKFNQIEADFVGWEFYAELQTARRIGISSVTKRKDTLTALNNLLPKIKQDYSSDDRKRYVKAVGSLYRKAKSKNHTEIKDDLKSLVTSVQTNEALTEFMGTRLGGFSAPRKFNQIEADFDTWE